MIKVGASAEPIKVSATTQVAEETPVIDEEVVELNAAVEEVEIDPVSNILTEKASPNAEPYQKYLGSSLDPSVTNPYVAQQFSNWETVNQVFSEEIENANERSTTESLFEWLDWSVLSFPRNIVSGLAKEGEIVGRRVEDIINTSQSTTEVRNRLKPLISEWRDTGWFTSDNLFYLQQRIDQASNLGYDPMANVDQFTAAAEGLIEVSTLGVGSLLKIAGRGLLKGSTPSARAAGVPKGGELVKTGKPIVQPQTTATKVEAKTNQNPYAAIATNNNVVQETSRRLASAMTGEDLMNVAKQRLGQINKSLAKRAVWVGYDDAVLDRNILEVRIGTDKGKPYVKEAAAVKAKDSIQKQNPTAEVEIKKPEEGIEGYTLAIKSDVTPLDLELDTVAVPDSAAVSSLLARTFGSSLSNVDDFVRSVINRNEATESLLSSNLRKLFDSEISSLPRETRNTLNDVMEDLFNGTDQGLKHWYNRSEFNTKWVSKTNRQPTEREWKAFSTFRELTDAAAFLQADNVLKRYINKGYIKVDDYVAKPVGNLGSKKTLVFDIKTKKRIKWDGATQLYKLAEPLRKKGKQTLEYVVNPEDVKLLRHDDVFGYNAGPRRENPNARYFVTADNYAFLTAFTPKEATKAVNQINTLLKSSSLTDDIVLANNDWNTNLQTVKDWEDFVKANDLDGKTISTKKRDEPTPAEALDSNLGLTYGEFVAKTAKRGNVLTQYGGDKAAQLNPAEAIAKQLTSASQAVAFNSATVRAKKGFADYAKRVSDDPTTPDVVKNRPADDNDVDGWLNATIVGNSRQAHRLRRIRTGIRNRINRKTDIDRVVEASGEAIVDFVYDTVGKKARVDDLQSKMLQLNFQSVFGFLNISQFFIQGMQAASIAALNPVDGARGAGLAIPFRQLIHSTNPATRQRILTSMSKVTGVDAEVLLEAEKYIKNSGREILDGTAVEQNTGFAYNWRSFGNESYSKAAYNASKDAASKALRGGLIPFNQGERFSRKTGILTAHIEYRRLFPNELFGTDKAKAWISNREQQYTFNMNNASNSAFQRGWLKVPAQWMSYTFRAMETIVTGDKGFTAAQRARLAAFLTVGMGTAHMGLSGAVDTLSEQLGQSPDSSFHKFLKWGVIDGMLDAIGVPASVSGRVSLAGGIMDLYDKTQDSLVETVAGPSGSIIVEGFGGSILNIVKDLYLGNEITLDEEGVKILRNIRGIDNVAAAEGILTQGYYRSRNGVKYPNELDATDAVIFLMGFKPQEYTAFLNAKERKYFRDRSFAARRKEINKKAVKAFDLFKTDNPEDIETGKQLLKEIQLEITYATPWMTEAERDSLRRSILNQKNEVDELILDLNRKGRNTEAQELSQ